MEKLRFDFALLPGSDGKTNVLCVTSIAKCDEKVYEIPELLQSVSHHKELMRNAAFGKVKNSLGKRYQIRRVWITMTEELKNTYVDEHGNLQFGDQYLEELQEKISNVRQNTETSSLERLIEKLIENKQPNLKNIAEKFVIEKFNSKNTNASQWIEMFEKECLRFEVTTDEKKIEILRLFMDKTCIDWYSSMIIKLTMNSEWSNWKIKFCETFANKGWNTVTRALLFRYIDGSLLDYATKKEKLLLDMRTKIDNGTVIDLIASGLPEFILNRIDREGLQDTVDLFNKLSKYEHMVNKKSFLANKKFGNAVSNKNKDKNPCIICEKLNKGTRYHPEASCWFKTNEDDKFKRNAIKHVNNSVIETELNENDKKN